MSQRYYQTASGITTVDLDPVDSSNHSESLKIFTISWGGQSRSVTLLRREGPRLVLLIDGQPTRALIASNGNERHIHLDGLGRFVAERVSSPRPARRARHAAEDTLVANTPAQVMAIPVAVGDKVAAHATLVVLEAMKMEFRVAAPHAGTILRIGCHVGEVVERGRILVELHPVEE